MANLFALIPVHLRINEVATIFIAYRLARVRRYRWAVGLIGCRLTAFGRKNTRAVTIISIHI
jgi:hypothetical protein